MKYGEYRLAPLLESAIIAILLILFFSPGTNANDKAPELSNYISTEFNKVVPQLSNNAGAAAYHYSLKVPPGRAGMTPNLSLAYNSNKKNGPLGVGWSLVQPFIQRSTISGLNYSGNAFQAKTGDAVIDLVPRTAGWGSGYYGSKIESDFSKYIFLGASSEI